MRSLFWLLRTALFSVQIASLCQQLFNTETTQRGVFSTSRKHFLQKDLRISNLIAFHSISRCYYDYEIL
jgi:hypothetical protein